MGERTLLIPSTTIDNTLYDRFNWWDKQDKAVYGLHQLCDIRLAYINQVLDSRPSPKTILDIGCGGGIMTEQLRTHFPDASIVGIDISAHSIECAQNHATENNYVIDYRVGSAYETRLGDESCDMVVMLDILEHLDDLPRAIKEVSRILKPGGIFIFDTFNRTFLSWIFGIVFAEYVLKLLPLHTHDWCLFIKPSELYTLFKENQISREKTTGFETGFGLYDLIKYMLTAKPPRMFFSFSWHSQIQYFGHGIKHDR